MNDTERYQIAKEVMEEWVDNGKNTPLPAYIIDKANPVDPLKEVYNWLITECGFCNQPSYEYFSNKVKESFPKDDLNGTKGLDALKALLTNGVYTSDFLCKNIDIIKNELEK